MQVEKWDESRSGAMTEANMRKKLEAEGHAVRRYTYPSGTFFPDHDHGVEKGAHRAQRRGSRR